VAVEEAEPPGAAINFAVQVIVGTLLFSIALGVAFGLSKLVSWMELSGAPGWMIWGAHLAEKTVFGLDLFLFSLFLLSEALKFMIGLWKEWRP
jgi:hypothetical protein